MTATATSTTRKTLLRATTVAAVLGVSLVAGTGTAMAGTGALSRPGSYMSYNNHKTLAYNEFYVKDTASDGVCAHAYHYVGGWILMGSACGYGNSTSGWKWGSPSYVRVCTGAPNATASNCLKQAAA